MSKELEALERMEYFVNEEMGIKTFEQSGWHIEGTDDYELVKEGLQRLEAIENTNPSKALEWLDKSKNMMIENNGDFIAFDCLKVYSICKQALLKAQEQEKVLEIIFKKTVGIFQLSCCKNVYEYNDLKFNDYEKLTQEEFDLLKRWIECQKN